MSIPRPSPRARTERSWPLYVGAVLVAALLGTWSRKVDRQPEPVRGMVVVVVEDEQEAEAVRALVRSAGYRTARVEVEDP